MQYKNKSPRFNTAAQDSNPGSLSRDSEALPLIHGALHSIYVCIDYTRLVATDT